MKRLRSSSPTRDKLLDAAQQLMLAKGFTATTVDEICKTASLTKGSFFHYFASKEQLGQTVLERYVSTMLQTFQAAPFLREDDPLQRVYGYVDFVSEMAKNAQGHKGCLLGTFAQELSETHPEMRLACAAHFAHWTKVLQEDLEEAQAQYAPHAPWEAQSVAEYFLAVLQGSLILAKAQQDSRIVEKHLGHFKQYLRSLFQEDAPRV